MGHFRQKSAILFFINFAEYPQLAFLTNALLMVNYVTYNVFVFLVLWEALTLRFASITSTRHL